MKSIFKRVVMIRARVEERVISFRDQKLTQQRSKEISIRKVLGASVVALCKLLTTEFVLLVAVASCVALPMTHVFMNGWLAQYNYRFHPGAGALWIIAGAFVIAVTTVSFQALRSALRNPIENLKSE